MRQPMSVFECFLRGCAGAFLLAALDVDWQDRAGLSEVTCLACAAMFALAAFMAWRRRRP